MIYLILHFLSALTTIIAIMWICDKCYYKFIKPFKKIKKEVKNEKKRNSKHA
jgi:ribosomal protein L37AE/L43A